MKKNVSPMSSVQCKILPPQKRYICRTWNIWGCVWAMKSCNSLYYWFFLWFFLQFGIRDILENAAGQESEELCLNCNPNGSLRSVSIPSSFLLRCSKECTFLLSPSQNWKKPNVLIAQGDVHMKSHIYPMCKGRQLFLIFCFILSSRP